MQEVHTFRRLGVPETIARTVWMFGFQRRRVRTCECDTLLPKPGPLPQTSQTEATAASISRIGGVCQRLTRRRCKHQRETEAAWEAYPTGRPSREPHRLGESTVDARRRASRIGSEVPEVVHVVAVGGRVARDGG